MSGFKIVQTVENGQFELTIVPSAWEEDAKLKWPKIDTMGKVGKVNFTKLIRDQFSTPSSNWAEYPCVVKRNGLRTYEAAEIELDAIACKSDTDETVMVMAPRSNRKRKCTTAVSSIADLNRNNFNSVAKTLTTCIGSDSMFYEVSECAPHTNQEYIIESPEPPKLNDECPSKMQGNATKFFDESWASPVPPEISYIEEQQLVDIDSLFALLKTAVEQIATLNAKVDKLDKTVLKLIDSIGKQSIEQNPHLEVDFEKIETEEDLLSFEAKLTDEGYAAALHHKFKQHCGVNSMRGDNAAYELIDVFFDRKLMTKYSWTGCKKKGFERKNAFRSLKCVYSFLYELIKVADPTYTEVDMENFIKKKWLPNTLRRSIAPRLRVSRSKYRAKRAPSEEVEVDIFKAESESPTFDEGQGFTS